MCEAEYMPEGVLTCWGIQGCRPNGLLFHQKSLYMGSSVVKTSLESHFTKLQKKKKNVKSAIF